MNNEIFGTDYPKYGQSVPDIKNYGSQNISSINTDECILDNNSYFYRNSSNLDNVDISKLEEEYNSSLQAVSKKSSNYQPGQVFDKNLAEILEQIDSGSYLGIPPKYDKFMQKFVKLNARGDMEKLLNSFKTNEEKKLAMELIIYYKENKKTEGAFTKEIADFKERMNKDTIDEFKKMYKEYGFKSDSLLDSVIKNLPVIASLLEGKFPGISDFAEKISDLAKQSEKKKNENSPLQEKTSDFSGFECVEKPEDIPQETKDEYIISAEDDINNFCRELKNQGRLKAGFDRSLREYSNNFSTYHERAKFFMTEEIPTPESYSKKQNELTMKLKAIVANLGKEHPEFKKSEMKAAYYALEEAACTKEIENLENELVLRRQGKTRQSNYAEFSNEDIEKAIIGLKEDKKTIHSVYREVQPSWWSENSDKVMALVISAAVLYAQNRGQCNNKDTMMSNIFEFKF